MMRVTKQMVEAVARFMDAEAAGLRTDPYFADKPDLRAHLVEQYERNAEDLRAAAWFAPPSVPAKFLEILHRWYFWKRYVS